mmetsp:Transcript_15580/g.35747  ORF Transcript_15580/g.35747 Transcript_15580/m.35747 type:complete len:355 (+) Transcript_15580:49-1113(+)
MTSAKEQLATIRQYESGNDVRQIISCSEGGRALRLLKKREEATRAAENEFEVIENETKKRTFSRIDQKFGASHADVLEEEFKNATVGLVSAQEFKAKRQAIDDIIQSAMRKGQGQQKVRTGSRVNAKKLSFQDQEDNDFVDTDEEEDEDAPRKVLGKNPTVDTSFLYDAEREEEVHRQRAELIEQYKQEQEAKKKDKLEVTYSYWDGSGHRRAITIEKGFTIGQFLAKSKADLAKTDFPELRSMPTDSLLYIKEDLIIPHNITFYDLIKEKARGKSGPLFNFDVHDDVRINNDVRVEKDESHAGKIVDRKWYERNKHIFPACRWEIYDKSKTYEKYTVAGDNDFSKPLPSTLKG